MAQTVRYPVYCETREQALKELASIRQEETGDGWEEVYGGAEWRSNGKWIPFIVTVAG